MDIPLKKLIQTKLSEVSFADKELVLCRREKSVKKSCFLSQYTKHSTILVQVWDSATIKSVFAKKHLQNFSYYILKGVDHLRNAS